MKQYYECHVTLDRPEGSGVEALKEVIEAEGWKFSAIEGDPILGDGVKCYSTIHYSVNRSFASVRGLLYAHASALRAHGFTVKREKVELVMWDAIAGRDF